jgi:putative flippase GtrA
MALSASKILLRRNLIALLDRLGIWSPGSFTLGRFLLVGTIGYLVNQFSLFLFYDTHVLWFLPGKDVQKDIGLLTIGDSRLLIASIAAVELSIVSNFLWHDRWTFQDRVKKPLYLRFAQFNTTSLGSPIIAISTLNILTPHFGIHYLVANSIGIMLGVTWNWLWNTRFIWRRNNA